MEKKNIIYILTYLAAISVVLLGALFYRQPVLTALLLMMFLLPVLSLVVCSKSRGNLKVSFETLPVAIYSQDQTQITLKMNVENKGWIPLLNCSMDFRYQNRFYPNDNRHVIIFAAPSRSVRSYELRFDSLMPGLFEFEAGNIKVTDMLHLKTWEIPFVKRMKTAILPCEAEIESTEIKKAALEEEAENSLTGEMSREVRLVREYMPGDKLRDMHWKQTARLDTPMVREFERMRESFYVLFPVIEPGKTARDGAGSANSDISVWYSLAMKLIKQGETVYTLLYDADTRSFEKIKAASEDELIQTVYELYCRIPGNFVMSDELMGRLCEEVPDAVVIRDGKIKA